MRITSPLSLSFLALSMTVHAGPRSSASYSIATDTADAGGKRTTSASYTNFGSVGGVGGTSTGSVPIQTARSGYVGQLFEVTGLTLTAATLDLNEGTTNQFAAWLGLDDATFLAVPSASVVWAVQSGPLNGISASGLAVAGVVFQHATATVQGIYLGYSAALALTVKNVNLDNFGSYAGDGLDDAWQDQYFGTDSPNAAPQSDPDGDGQSNRFEFTAGLIPIDPGSRFVLQVVPGPNQSTPSVVFSPRLPDRIYIVTFKPDLDAANWTTLSGGSITDVGSQRTVSDTTATGSRRFYQVEITKP